MWKNIPEELLASGISGDEFQFDDEGYNSTDIEDFDHDYIDDEIDEEFDEKNFPNFVTLTKLQPVLPPVILMGGKVKEGMYIQYFDFTKFFPFYFSII